MGSWEGRGGEGRGGERRGGSSTTFHVQFWVHTSQETLSSNVSAAISCLCQGMKAAEMFELKKVSWLL